ncbi:MAG: SEL1-like repeat protein [Bacteroidaceae bacterium]|nr:SEL1-like repeat protein [Bacteroidaceae bacterium]
MQKNKILFFIIYLLAVCGLQAQTPSDSAALRALQIGRILPPEQVYMQFDNTAYFLGDTLWFKAQVTSNNDDRPTELSRVLYVELTAPEGYVIKTEKYKLDDAGTCVGEFYLDPLYYSGYFEIRAYTRYMLNWGEHAHFSRVFPVFDQVNGNNWEFKNMLERKRRYMAYDNKDVNRKGFNSLNFYPEGGHLVRGIESRVAYEVLGEKGVDVNNEVVVYADGKELLRTTPQHMGKGSFTLTPEEGVKYTAEVYINNDKGKGKKHKFKFPAIEKEGVAMAVKEAGDSIMFSIKNNYPAATELGFAVMHRSSLGFYKRIQNCDTCFAIDKNGIYEGVCRAVVFSGTTPLAERMFFVEHDSLLANDRRSARLRVKANDSNITKFAPKAHAKVKLVIEREDSLPIEDNAEFSVSVMDQAGKQQTSWGYNMYSYLLLGSEVKGYIPDAGQYFDRSNKKRKEHLDLVMLTNGWSAYDWEKLTAEEFTDIVDPEKGITLRGKFYQRSRRIIFNEFQPYQITPMPYTLVRMDIAYNPDTVVTSAFRLDENASFSIDLREFHGKRIAALLPKTTIKHGDRINYRFVLDRYFSPRSQYMAYWEHNLGKSLIDDSGIEKKSKEYILLDNIEITRKKKNKKFDVPPISELRLDYLEEWEYATDVTFFDGNTYSDMIDSINHGLRILDSEEKQKLLDDYSQEEQDAREQLYIFNDVLTASNVVTSIFHRYALPYSYWVHNVVVKGEYHKDSTLVIDHEYLHGTHPEKMANFKEVVITSDAKKTKQITGGDGEYFWESKGRALGNKGKHGTIFYQGFLSLQSILPFSQGEDYRDIFIRRLKDMYGLTYKDHISRPSSPNRLACFIPYKEGEERKGVVPELTTSSSTCRYTSIQGYSESKQFYSPDYSQAPPTEKDYRRTLLWSPRVKAADGKVVVEFYNSSECDAIAVNVEGRAGDIYYSNDETMPSRAGKKDDAARQKNIMVRSIEALKDSIFWAECDEVFKEAEIYHHQKRYSKGLTTYIELAQYGYPAAMYRIGEYYRDGHALKINKLLAFKFMLKAAKKGEARAQHDVALMYRNGEGTEKDLLAAIHWFEKAVEQGYAASEFELGKSYIENRDSIEGMALLHKSALQENGDALYLYSRCMEAENIERDSLLGTPLDATRKAAVLNNVEALRYMMQYDDSCANYKEAYQWAMTLRKHKDVAGIKYLAHCYRHGLGTKKNKRLAKDLYRDAVRMGDKEAQRILEEW